MSKGNKLSAMGEVLKILDVEPLEVNLFRGVSPKERSQRVFGGQVIGQAMVAAARTVEEELDRPAHSLHCYFLRPGDPQSSDHLRSGQNPGRAQFYNTARRRDPAWQGDLHHGCFLSDPGRRI